MPPIKLPPFSVLRTVILFFFSLGGMTWEIVAEQGDRPTLLIILGMMAGLPIFLNVDDLYKNQRPPPKDEEK